MTLSHADESPALATPRKLGLAPKLAFGIGQMAEGVKNNAFNTFVVFYYNQVLELPGTLSGLALAVALVFDAITDPVAGSLSDKLKSRWGPQVGLGCSSAASCWI